MITAAYAANLSAVLGWEWTEAQAEIVRSLTRFTGISGGDRSGKSVFTARWCHLNTMDFLEAKMAEGKKRDEKTILGVGWIVAAHYEKTWQEFKYLEEHLLRQFGKGAVDFSTAINPGLGKILTPFGQFLVRTKSALDESSLVMEAPVWIAVVEAAQVPYGAYLRLQGRAAEHKSPILLSGSLEEDIGWYPSLIDRWESPAVWEMDASRSWRVPSHTNTFAFPMGEADP